MAQRVDRLERLPQGVLAGRRDREVQFALAPALRRRLALARSNEPLLLQPVEARVDAAGGGLATGAILDVLLDRHPIGIGVQSDDGEQQVLLQGRQFCVAHNFVFIEEIGRMQGGTALVRIHQRPARSASS